MEIPEEFKNYDARIETYEVRLGYKADDPGNWEMTIKILEYLSQLLTYGLQHIVIKVFLKLYSLLFLTKWMLETKLIN